MNIRIFTLKKCCYCGKRLKFLCSFISEDGETVLQFECKHCRQMAYLNNVPKNTPKGGEKNNGEEK